MRCQREFPQSSTLSSLQAHTHTLSVEISYLMSIAHREGGIPQWGPPPPPRAERILKKQTITDEARRKRSWKKERMRKANGRRMRVVRRTHKTGGVSETETMLMRRLGGRRTTESTRERVNEGVFLSQLSCVGLDGDTIRCWLHSFLTVCV